MAEPDEPERPPADAALEHSVPSQSIFVRSRFAREGTGLEFDRVANFADAIYAISLTLIVVGIVAPKLSDDSSAGELADELGPLVPDIITFFIVFVVVGNYWIAHHRYMSWLGEVDRTLIGIQLVYLSVIAFLPFPVALLGSTGSNPLAFAMFAVSMAAASGLETVDDRARPSRRADASTTVSRGVPVGVDHVARGGAGLPAVDPARVRIGVARLPLLVHEQPDRVRDESTSTYRVRRAGSLPSVDLAGPVWSRASTIISSMFTWLDGWRRTRCTRRRRRR